jgi:hypothetical protein
MKLPSHNDGVRKRRILKVTSEIRDCDPPVCLSTDSLTLTYLPRKDPSATTESRSLRSAARLCSVSVRDVVPRLAVGVTRCRSYAAVADTGRRDTDMRVLLAVCTLCRSCAAVADTGRRDTEMPVLLAVCTLCRSCAAVVDTGRRDTECEFS